MRLRAVLLIFGLSLAGCSVSRDNMVGFLARISCKMDDCGNFPVAVGGYQATTAGTFVTVNA